MRLELTRPNGHYPLKVARLPIPPLLHNYAKLTDIVPRTGLEPACLSTLAPETSASTIPPPGQLPLSGKRGSNSRPQPWQGCALPTELFPRFCETWHFRQRSLRESKLSHSLARKFRIDTQRFVLLTKIQNFKESGKRGSNSRPQPWQGCALPTELFPRFYGFAF